MIGPNTAAITTVVGAALAIAIGVTDAWFFQRFGYDQLLIGGGLGALLGVNPLVARP